MGTPKTTKHRQHYFQRQQIWMTTVPRRHYPWQIYWDCSHNEWTSGYYQRHPLWKPTARIQRTSWSIRGRHSAKWNSQLKAMISVSQLLAKPTPITPSQSHLQPQTKQPQTNPLPRQSLVRVSRENSDDQQKMLSACQNIDIMPRLFSIGGRQTRFQAGSYGRLWCLGRGDRM